MNRTLTWFAMQAGTRFANIGSEVNRAIQWRRRGMYSVLLISVVRQ